MLKIFEQPAQKLGNIFYKLIIIAAYKSYFYSKKIQRKIFLSENFQPVYIFINKYSPHIFIITIALGVIFTNLFMDKTSAQSFGEKSVLYALATGSDEEYVEESINPEVTKTQNNYLENQNNAVSSTPNIATGTEEETQTSISGNGAILKPEIPSIEAAQGYRSKTTQYTVAQGDTIGSIAEKFGITENTILWENNLTQYSTIRPGQKLTILPTSGIGYTIVRGDTLAGIAKKYKADKEKIISYNKLADESDINIGETLIIPGGQPYRPTASSVATNKVKQVYEEPTVSVTPGQMVWPNGCRRITQYYSWKHTGVDIACPIGTPIRAAKDGVIKAVHYLNTGYGHSVDIDHGNGMMTRYGHMTTIYVKVGDNVKAGQTIGLEGSTGHSTGPHLHFEVRIWGKIYNPLNYIK